MTEVRFQRGLFALTPFFVCIMLFFLSSFLCAETISPLFIGIISALYAVACTFDSSVSFHKRIELFIQGTAQPIIIAMCYIFFLSTVFTFVLKAIGGVDAAVSLALYAIPSQAILPGLFTLISFFAVAIGSSMSAIAAFMPIAVTLADALNVDPALMAGVVVGGAMLGDNLSVVSDTTIAATQAVGAKMADKFKVNFFLVLPAFLATISILFYVSSDLTAATHASQSLISKSECISLTPYILILCLALYGLDVLATLLIGIFAGIFVGWWNAVFTFCGATNLFLEAFSRDTAMQEVLWLVLLIGGIAHIVEYNGGIEYLLHISTRRMKKMWYAELTIFLLTALVNAFIAINTITILVMGPLVKRIAQEYGISPQRAASLLDIASCFCQGVLPYAPQLLLAASLAHVSPISILFHAHYQYCIAVVTLFSIMIGQKNKASYKIA